VAAVRIKDPGKIGLQAGRVLNKRKMAKHFTLDIAEGRLAWQRDQASIDAEALTDRIYVIRTPSSQTPSTPPDRGRLQGAIPPRTRLPLHQGRRPGSAPHLAPARGPATSARLAAWAGLAPGDNESADKRRHAAARQGNRHPRAAMTEAAVLGSRPHPHPARHPVPPAGAPVRQGP
jgi:hypothetical protein